MMIHTSGDLGIGGGGVSLDLQVLLFMYFALGFFSTYGLGGENV